MWLDITWPQQSNKGPFVPLDPLPCSILPIHIKLHSQEFSIQALLNTGALACFIDEDFASQHNLVHMKKNHAKSVEIINGRSLPSEKVIEKIEQLEVPLEDQVSRIVLNIIQSLANLVILGLP